ncbi:MAG TPA: lipase maturation factor family protein [bacterium]|nr:lipase maturation factor family protein [bacterium]
MIGPQGLFPASEILAETSFLRTPSLLWLGTSDTCIFIVVGLGLCGSLLVVLNRWNRIGLAVCWMVFLSIASVSPQFTWYKADGLLLECAFLGWFLAPSGRRPYLGEQDPPSFVVLFAHLWLLFRLMFETGLAKAVSPDPVWRDLDAMAYFHQNMPFPTWVGWLFSQLPYGFHRFETAFTLLGECFAPFLLFCGRRARFIALVLWFCLQTGIILSGNFLAFNYLSIGLGLLFVGYPLSKVRTSRWKEAAYGLVLLPQMLIGFALLLSFPIFPGLTMPGPVAKALETAAPFRSANVYILYPFIERERRILVLEGSDDGGATWREYGYRWQTQRLDRRPEFLSPLSDRFEREMQRVLERPGVLPYWQNEFVLRTARRLIEGSGPVSRLFAYNPFPQGGPERIRAHIYLYQSTDLRTLLAAGKWWTRRRVGSYGPPIARDPESGAINYVDSPSYRRNP